MTTSRNLPHRNHSAAVVQTALGLGLLFVLLAAELAGAAGAGGPTGFRLAPAVRFWSLALFVLVYLQGTRLIAFCPDTLRVLLPTPLTEEGIADRLWRRELRWLHLAALALSIPIMLTVFWQTRSRWHALAFLAFCLPTLDCLGLALRVLSLRARRLLILGGAYLCIAAGVVAGLDAYAGCATSGRGLADGVFQVGMASPLTALLAACVAALLHRPLAEQCRQLSTRCFVRSELLSVAFPHESGPKTKPRKMLVEHVGWHSLWRRRLFLFQELTGLVNTQRVVYAGCVWAVALAGALALFARSGGLSPAACFAATVAAVTTLTVWSTFGHPSRTWNLGTGKASAAPLPVGAVEGGAATCLLCAGAFVPGAVLTTLAGTWILWGDPASRLRFVVLCLENYGQALLLLVAAVVSLNAAWNARDRRTRLATTAVYFTTAAFVFAILWGAVLSPTSLFLDVLPDSPNRLGWGAGLAEVLRLAVSPLLRGHVPTLFWLRDYPPECQGFFSSLSVAALMPLWPFRLWAWFLSTYLCSVSMRLFLRSARGQCLRFGPRRQSKAGPFPFLAARFGRQGARGGAGGARNRSFRYSNPSATVSAKRRPR